ncbi:MAG: sensor histidine kinase [Rubrivivax sp.]|jgi:signal transduction histidine kinase|nr:HAMP domain-containing histidine kinase [Rubrivivax sp.]
MTLHRRWMLALALFTLVVTALFGLFAMAFVYTVEDRFLDRLLIQEASAQQAHRQQHGRWGRTGADFIVLHESAATLPAEVAEVLSREPNRLEMAGMNGRHYHLLPLEQPGRAPWLVAEVSQQLIVRPIRTELLTWLAGWGLAMVALALVLGWVLARRVTAPLETLAGRVAAASPGQHPVSVAQGLGKDEVGEVARAFDALLARTHDFIVREQAFTRDASHELRTPLAVLLLGIERLQADPAMAPSLQTALATLHASTLWMQQTVSTLLVLAREGESNPGKTHEPVAVLPLLEQWVLAHADWLDRQALSLDVQLDRQARLRLPTPVLQLALASLLGNAFVHGRAGGQVRVDFDDQALCITNPDAESPQAGHGFGLAIVQRLLDAAGGRLELIQHGGTTRARVLA